MSEQQNLDVVRSLYRAEPFAELLSHLRGEIRLQYPELAKRAPRHRDRRRQRHD